LGSRPHSSEFPSWYTHELTRLRRSYPKGPSDDELARTRTEFRSSLTDFFAQVRYVISLYVALFSLAAAIIYFALKEGHLPSPLLFCAGGILIMAHFLGAFFNNIILQMYDLYVSSVLYSQQLHVIAGKDTHRWFDVVAQRLNTHPKDKKSFVLLWSTLPDSTYRSYVSIINTVRYAALIVGTLLTAFAVATLVAPDKVGI
jgi:hypothetical protein